MSKSKNPRFPVTITQLPVMRCQVCQRGVAHQPNQASAALTEHYRKMHPQILQSASQRK